MSAQMRARRAVRGGGVSAVVAALLLAGCTSSGGDADRTAGSSDKPGSGKTAPAPGGVLVEQTIGTPTAENRETDVPLGGNMTVTVRSVVASEGRTVMTWALRWDDPDTPDGTSVPVDDFFDTQFPPVLTDGEALKYYYPLCDSDWHSVISSQYCEADALFSPSLHSHREVVNHQTFEAWAVFPEVGEDTTTVDLTLPGLAAFPTLPVTRS